MTPIYKAKFACQQQRPSQLHLTLMKAYLVSVSLNQLKNSYNCLIQMYKRKDNDIFGTAGVSYAPRIENNSYIDPNAAFKKKMEDNYDRYASKVPNVSSSITAKPLDASKVNQKANFEENYHKNRKEADLQSSIFYEPTPKPIVNDIESEKDKLACSQVSKAESNFGRKETFKREINSLPYNENTNRGNSSRLFDLDERIGTKTGNMQYAPLIPYQMQWDQHDSVKYAHINDPNKGKEPRVTSAEEITDIDESKSTFFNQEEVVTKDVKEQKKENNTMKKVKSQKDIKKVQPTKGAKEPVEIKILKGWDYKLMEGLSRHCKLAGSAIVRFECEDASKATLVIKRSERWENVTDWLRKDAKLKIRVINN